MNIHHKIPLIFIYGVSAILCQILFGYVLLCLYLVVCHAEHIRMYMEFIPMEFISLILLGMLLAGRYQRHHNESAQGTE